MCLRFKYILYRNVKCVCVPLVAPLYLRIYTEKRLIYINIYKEE